MRKNVWIGQTVYITLEVSIGVGSVIGTNAIVTHDIPAYSVVVGVLAKVIQNLK